MSKIRSIFISAIAILITAGIFFAVHADMSAMSRISVAELATMKQMAEESVSYETALNRNSPVLLEFYADWCTTCQSLSPMLSELRKQYSDKIDFVMLNIDDSQWTKIIKQYAVTGVPEFFFLNANHEVDKHLVGNVPETVMIDCLEKISI